MQITEDAPIDITVYRSTKDGALVVEIDTTDETGDVRINLNDRPIWDGDPESTTGARDLLVAIEVLRHNTHKVHVDGPGRDELDRQFRIEVESILHNAGVRGWKE